MAGNFLKLACALPSQLGFLFPTAAAVRNSHRFIILSAFRKHINDVGIFSMHIESVLECLWSRLGANIDLVMCVCLCIHARNSFQSKNLFPYNSIYAPEYGIIPVQIIWFFNACQEAGIVAYFMQNMCSCGIMDSMK